MPPTGGSSGVTAKYGGNLIRDGSGGNITPGGVSSVQINNDDSNGAGRAAISALKQLENVQKDSAYEKGYQDCLKFFREKQKQEQELKKMQLGQQEEASAYKKGYNACLEYFKQKQLSPAALTSDNVTDLVRTLSDFPGPLGSHGGLHNTTLGALSRTSRSSSPGPQGGSLPCTPLGSFLTSLPGTLQKDIKTPIIIVPSSPMTPIGSPLTPLYTPSSPARTVVKGFPGSARMEGLPGSTTTRVTAPENVQVVSWPQSPATEMQSPSEPSLTTALNIATSASHASQNNLPRDSPEVPPPLLIAPAAAKQPSYSEIPDTSPLLQLATAAMSEVH